jgi:predicted Zn finger-like uncharacterized protein
VEVVPDSGRRPDQEEAMEKVPIGRIQVGQSVACPTCRAVLSENALGLAIQGRSVRCSKCRTEIKLSEETRAVLRKARNRQA